MIINGVLYDIYRRMMENSFYYDVESVRVCDENTGKLVGWKVTYWCVEKKIFPTRMQWSCFFKETWFRNSERAAERFKNRLLEKNENNK